jgi:hypothetical protein
MYDNDDKEKTDNESWKSVGSAITKIIICICLCITIGFIFNSCGVSKEDMQECKSVCGTRGMISVSEWSCQCGWSSNSNDYVIPRKKK